MVCRVCEIDKSLDAFEKQGNSYRKKCKRCRNTESYAKTKSDPARYSNCLERNKLFLRQYRATPEGRQVRAESVKNWRSRPENRVKLRGYVRKHSQTEKGIDARREKQRRYYWANPEKFRLAQIRHRFDLSNTVLLKEVLDRDKVCQLCGTDQDLSFDHVYPRSLGGKVERASDLQILCKPCNSWKNARWLQLPDQQGFMRSQ